MKVSELMILLQDQNPDAEVIMGSHNGEVNTYAVVDHIHHFKYGEIYNDFYGTPGPMDCRFFTPEMTDDKDMVYIGSLFPYKHKL